MRRVATPIAAAAGVALVSVALVALMLAVAGYDPGSSLMSLWRGAFGSWNAFASATLVRATPLIVGGLAVAVAFRSGVLNIGVEGQLLAGAAAATACALATSGLGIVAVPLTLAAGALGGAAWGAVPAALKRRMGVLEVITTLMLNVVALQVVGWLVRGPLQEPTRLYPQSALIAESARLPFIAPGTRLHAGILMALILVGVTWWAIARTAAGFRVRATGANPHAAESAGGIDVGRVSSRVLLVSAALAGLAGAIEVQGVTFALYESLSPGYGYTAIAVALLARLDARAVVPSALLFAALESGSSAMQRDAGVPSALVKVVVALLIVLVLIAEAWRRRRVTAVGVPEMVAGQATGNG